MTLGDPSATRGVRPGNSSTQFEPKREERDIMKNLFARFIKDEEGQDLIEYALLAAFIAVVAITAITAVGTKVNAVFDKVNTTLGTSGT